MHFVVRNIGLIVRVLLIALVCVSCNKPRFATSEDEEVARYIQLSTRMEKSARSVDTEPFTGVGILSLQSTYPLQKVECRNCIENGTLLTFEKTDRSGASYIYDARFNFSYVQNTQACLVDLFAVFADDPDSPVNKSYNIVLCPFGADGKPVCDEDSAVNNCSNIKILSGS